MKKLAMDKSKSLTERLSDLCGFDKNFYVTKRLNSLGYFTLMASYTLAVVFLTLHFQKKIIVPGSAQDLSSVKEEIIAELKSEFQIELRKQNASRVEFGKLREDILKEVMDLNLSYYELTRREKGFRAPAEQATPEKGEVVPFNRVNEAVLLEKQSIELKRFKEELEVEGQAYLKALGPDNAEKQKKWKNYLDLQKLKITKMKAQHLQQWRKFRDQKYISLSGI